MQGDGDAECRRTVPLVQRLSATVLSAIAAGIKSSETLFLPKEAVVCGVGEAGDNGEKKGTDDRAVGEKIIRGTGAFRSTVLSSLR